jgi:hypothetical protein
MAVDRNAKFVGIQISPISFIDEGIDGVLDTLQQRIGVNVLLIGSISWLGLKVGRRISHQLEGWPDHGVQAPYTMKGGAYWQTRAEYYAHTGIKDFRSQDAELAGRDILAEVIPAAKKRGMQVIPEMMEPLFKYAGHGSASAVEIANMPQYLEVDAFGRIAAEPCTSNPNYRRWWLSLTEDQCRNYEIDGIMWCNERNSPLDRMIQGQAPGCFCEHCRREARERGIDVEACRRACLAVHSELERLRRGEGIVDGALIEFLRVLLANPEMLIWERYWLERNKDLDRELYGLVKWCNPALSFGLNVWNRNHFNPFRKAQWPWAEQTTYSDWVKPITYQHQAGEVYVKEMTAFHRTLLRDFTPQELTPVMYRILGLNEAPWDELIATGMAPQTYVGGQCADTLKAVGDKVAVYMGIGVDAPRVRKDQAVCTPEIVYESVKATYAAGGHGVVFSPNYAGMNLSNLDGAAQALKELGLHQ